MHKGRLRHIILLFLYFFTNDVLAQESSRFGIHFSGFVNAQAFFDTRQIVEAREGMVSLFPKNIKRDPDGDDIHSKASFNQAAMTTRLRGTITGPDALGAQTMGVIETDFTGSSNADNNGLRLREAWVKLQWERIGLLIGQYWHPLYVPEVRPKTIGLNLGAPFHPFARHNQIRLDIQFGEFKIIAVAASQRDYANDGPKGRTPDYLRNAVLPNLDLQMQWKLDQQLLGFGMDYKMIQPRLSVEITPGMELKTNEKVSSLAFTAFAKMDFKHILLKLQGVWGQNLTEFIMLGGYVEKDIDTVQNNINYIPTNQLSFWADLSTNGKSLKFGMLAGYAKNLGYEDYAEGRYYGLGRDISYLYRISPRVEWYSGKFMLGMEFEYTVAAYGLAEKDGTVSNVESVGNLRCLAAAFYFF
jgi:hypothetical protein